ncbi:MAG TPA: hypothetical protein VFD75_19560 [Pyrinomonadaceae bacterium]|nr:hypothetical protein [Pyrinomonadaceae bacterium]
MRSRAAVLCDFASGASLIVGKQAFHAKGKAAKYRHAKLEHYPLLVQDTTGSTAPDWTHCDKEKLN